MNWELQRGFSLIEMVTSLLVISILISISIPSYLESQKSALIKKEAIELLTVLEIGQTEALKRRVPIFVHYVPKKDKNNACIALSLTDEEGEARCDDNNGMKKFDLKNKDYLQVLDPKDTSPKKIFYFSPINGSPSTDKTIRFTIDNDLEKVSGVLVRRYKGLKGCSHSLVAGWEKCL